MGEHSVGERDKLSRSVVLVTCLIAVILLVVGVASFFSFDQPKEVTNETMQGVWTIDFERSVYENPNANSKWLTSLAKTVDSYEFVVVGETMTFKTNGNIVEVCPMDFVQMQNNVGKWVDSLLRRVNCGNETWMVMHDYQTIRLGLGLDFADDSFVVLTQK